MCIRDRFHAAYYYDQYGSDAFNQLVKIIRDAGSKHGRDTYLMGDVINTWIGDSRRTTGVVRAFDAVTAYNVACANGEEFDSNGNIHLVKPYNSMVDGYVRLWAWWSEQAKNRLKGFIPPLCPGFDNSMLFQKGVDKWLVSRTSPTIQEFRRMCEGSIPYIDPNLGMVIVEAWNEFQERSVIEPTKESGFSYLQVIRDLSRVRSVSWSGTACVAPLVVALSGLPVVCQICTRYAFDSYRSLLISTMTNDPKAGSAAAILRSTNGRHHQRTVKKIGPI